MRDPIRNICFHGFSDAAEKVFATCIYMKTVTQSGSINVSLITAKSRMKPVSKEFTMPELELLGNFILSQLMVTVSALEGEIKIDENFCWKYSLVSLAWIKFLKFSYRTEW